MAERRNAARPPAPLAAEREYETRRSIDQRIAAAAGRALKRRAQAVLRWTFAQIGAATRGSELSPAPLRAGDPSVRRILVVRVDLLGDVVLSTAAVRALRRAYPRATIDMLVQTPYVGILEGDPDIHRVISWNQEAWANPANWLNPIRWPQTWGALARLRMPRYDLAISVQGDIGSIVTRLTNARRRVGYARESYRWFMTDPVPGGRYLERAHETRYILRLADAAGAPSAPEDEHPKLTVSPEAVARVHELLGSAWEERETPHGPVIALHAGARNGQAKRWPARHWAALARRLTTDLGALVVLTGGPSENPLAAEIQKLTAAPLLNLCGKTTLPELKALLSLSNLVISGDSGPMHIACAVGTPVIALHGPTDPMISGPSSPDAIVIRYGLWCSPCYDASATAECRFGNPVCMKEVMPSMVYAAAHSRLLRIPTVLATLSQRTEPAKRAAHGAP